MHERSSKVRRLSQQGLTLVEIMVAITIMAVVMGAVAVGVFPALRRANCKTAVTEAITIQNQMGLYRAENGDCPQSLSQLHQAKFITKEPVDPWGKPYNFKCPGEKNPDSADVWSAGNDKQEGTADDVRGWVSVQEQCK